ncbi:zinc finger protein 177-like [Anopheles cruzii]|uniref:zinc finger protein 177-like n=1 Tax=Anopheles cruzii TaxID=68878 RepID=UPI0022EC3686|nr:zinc finger protein 177-like [Anopheles cruzii]
MPSLTICRLCLRDGPDDLNELKLSNTPLLQCIETFTSLKVFAEPIQHILIFICVHCEVLLTQFQEYRERCLKHNEIFKLRLRQSCSASDIDEKDVDLELIETVKLNESVASKWEQSETATNSKASRRSHSKSMLSGVSRRSQSRTIRISTAESDRKEVVENHKPVRKKIPTKPRMIACPQCGKMIVRGNMNKHLATHNPDRPKKSCSHCKKTFKDSQLLSVHINSHHTFERKYECDVCGVAYLRPNSLREHKLSRHSVEARYECKDCGMKFSNFSKKRHHYIAEHTTARPFACQYCDKAYKFKCDLTVHTRTHTGEKPFSCDICKKTFSKSYNVVIHKKSHHS